MNAPLPRQITYGIETALETLAAKGSIRVASRGPTTPEQVSGVTAGSLCRRGWVRRVATPEGTILAPTPHGESVIAEWRRRQRAEDVGPSALDALIGERIHHLMWRAQVTQISVGRAIGIDQAAVSKRLRGLTPWRARDLYVTADLLGVSPADLLPPRTAVDEAVSSR